MPDCVFEALEGDFAVELVDLAFHPSEVLMLAIDFDEDFGAGFRGAEGSEELCFVGEGGVARCEIVDGFFAFVGVVLFYLGAQFALQLVGGAAECEEEICFFGVGGLFAAVGEGLAAAADADCVGHAFFGVSVGASDGSQVDHIDVLQWPAFIGYCP